MIFFVTTDCCVQLSCVMQYTGSCEVVRYVSIILSNRRVTDKRSIKACIVSLLTTLCKVMLPNRLQSQQSELLCVYPGPGGCNSYFLMLSQCFLRNFFSQFACHQSSTCTLLDERLGAFLILSILSLIVRQYP